MPIEPINQMDLINLLEIFSQWEMTAILNNRSIPQEAVNLKLKLEQDIMRYAK